MNDSKNFKKPDSTPSIESRNVQPLVAVRVGDSLNESLSRASAISGITRSKPMNSKPAALPPSPPKRSKPKDE